MSRTSLIAVLLALAIIGVAAACDDGPNGGARPTANGPPATAGAFEEKRDALAAQLEAFRTNIGALPDDIREQLLTSCQELDQFVDGDDVAQVCDAIEDAIDQGDPGKIDLVLARLTELEPE